MSVFTLLGRAGEGTASVQQRIVARRLKQRSRPGLCVHVVLLLLFAFVGAHTADPSHRLTGDSIDEDVASGRFRSLGTLYLQHSGLSVDEEGSHFNAPLTLGRSGNMSLTYVRRAVDLQSELPSNAAGGGSGGADVPRVEVACYVARVHYSLREAYATSQSLHDLADQAVRDLTRRRSAADEAVAGEAKPHLRTKPLELHRGSVLATHQVHHRLRDIVRQKQEFAAQVPAASGTNIAGPPVGVPNPSNVADSVNKDDQVQKEEDLALEQLERESTIRVAPRQPSASPDDPPLSPESAPPSYVTFGDNLCFAAASPFPPFHHVADQARRSELSLSVTTGSRSCFNISELLATAHEGTNRHPRARAFSRLGDLVIAEYKKTNNWKFCRNVQHGLYFNASATISESNEPNGPSAFSYAEFRCLVTRFLVDVCLMVEHVASDEEGAEGGRASSETFVLRRGCSDNYGRIFTYAPLRHGRMDEVAASGSAADLRLPLTVRVCHEYRPAKVMLHSQAQGGGRKTPSDVTNNAEQGADVAAQQPSPHCVGCSVVEEVGQHRWYPSHEYVARLILEEFTKMHGALAGESHVLYDWSSADVHGRREMNTASGGWAMLWIFFAFLIAAMTIIGCLIRHG